MSERDPIDELNRFGAGLNATPGGDMPLAADQVRRRGDQIRRRRTALVAGAAAVVVAAVAVPVVALTTNQSPKHDNVADDSATVTTDDLLRDADTVYHPGEPTPWTTIDTYEGDGQATFHPCQRVKLSALGAATSLTRNFDWSGTEPTPGTGLSETIAEFDSDDEANAAYDQITEWLKDCKGRLPETDTFSVNGPRASGVSDAQKSAIYDIHWGPAPVEIDPYGESGYINETGLVLDGDRIAVLSLTIIGQDYNFMDEYGGTPVFRMLPKAAERLEPGGS